MESISNFLTQVDSILWGAPVLILLFAVGLLYSIKTKFFQFRKFGHIMKNTIGEIFSKKNAGGEGTLTPLQAVSTALSGCVGTGNISGVATALVIGGPGSVFWMWVISLFGMLTKCVEVTLAQFYRKKDQNGNYYGGPMYYIEEGLGKKWKPLATFFSIVIVLGGLGTAAFVQPFAMSNAMNNMFGIPHIVTVTVAVIITGIVILGGVKSIGKFCEKLTPLMCVLYVIGAIGVLIVNFRNIPTAFAMIFTYAFKPFAAVGGLAGSTIALAIRQGSARGTFSNEAGAGSSPMVHATAITPHPFKEGMYGSFEVFVDTIVVCSMTALAILSSNPSIWQSGVKDVHLTMSVFANVYGTAGNALVSICLTLFAFSTMVGWEVNYETAIRHIFGNNQSIINFMRFVWLVPAFLCLGKTPDLVWTVVDIAAGLWCIPNVIGLLMLSGVFMSIYKDYIAKYIDKTKTMDAPIEVPATQR
jgi:AGCS family alanine or glycine:cation symporter